MLQRVSGLSSSKAAIDAPSAQRLCPACAGPHLKRCAVEGHAIEVCPRCRGLWCKAAEWDPALLGTRPVAREATERGPDMVATGRSDRRCPTCGCALTRVRVDAVRDLEIDQCDRCGGVWFDRSGWESLEGLREWQALEKRIDAPTTWQQWWFQALSTLPVEINIPARRKPVVVWAIIATCVAVFVLQIARVVPVENLAFVAARPLWTPLGLMSLLTYQFLHAGVLHLVGNMYFLYILGDNVEDVMGRLPFTSFYLTCGLAAAGLHFLLNPNSSVPVLGASGAIAAVMAAYLVLFREARLTLMVFFRQIKVHPAVWIGIWLALQVYGLGTEPHSDSTHVAFAAHLGGFAAGGLIVWSQQRTLIARHPLLQLLYAHRLVTTASPHGR